MIGWEEARLDAWVSPALALLAGYLMGSIPFGLLVTRLAGAGDLRAIGSGNIGATNVLRTGRKGLALITLVLDAAKGFAAVFVGELIQPGLGALASVGAFYGHIFPVWLRFHGGKGIATFLGIALALHWPSALAFAAVWLICSLMTRYSSVGGVGAALAAPIASAFFFEAGLTLIFLAFALTVIWTHRANIGRLLEGTEPRIGQT